MSIQLRYISTVICMFCFLSNYTNAQSDSTVFNNRRPMLFNTNSIDNYLGRMGTSDQKSERKMLVRDLKVGGELRFVTIYRNMKESYEDMNTSDRNISFLDYPLVNLGQTGGVGNPMVNLSISGRVGGLTFLTNYSLFHSFTGSEDNSTNKGALSNGGLKFWASYSTKNVVYRLNIGGLISKKISRFIFGTGSGRQSFFDRLAGEDKRSFWKYDRMWNENQYKNSLNYQSLRGAILDVEFEKLNLKLTGLLGRTAATVGGINFTNNFPAIMYVLRAERRLKLQSLSGLYAFSYYKKDADIDRVSGIKDDVEFMSTDAMINLPKGAKANIELGAGRINAPGVDPSWGKALFLEFNSGPRLLPLPLLVSFFNIGNNAGNLDGTIINSNPGLRFGGASGSDGFNLAAGSSNLALDINEIANNRVGTTVNTTIDLGTLKAEIGYSLSQEKENLSNSVTFYHNVNAFSRSRFTQWQQSVGPYDRINSMYARTTESLSITDDSTGTPVDYKKGFNNLDLLLKYQLTIFSRKLLLFNRSNFVSIQDQFSVTPIFSNDAFVKTFFNEFTLAYKVNKKLMFLANAGIERAWGGQRTELTEEIKEGEVTIQTPGKAIDQIGQALGFGFGYDFSTRATFHFRHKWMTHEDKNFVLDRFRGQETTVELKIFL